MVEPDYRDRASRAWGPTCWSGTGLFRPLLTLGPEGTGTVLCELPLALVAATRGYQPAFVSDDDLSWARSRALPLVMMHG